MALNFVLGGAGYGKSRCIYKKILDEAGMDPNGDYIVVVPEQSSMNTQKALTDLARAYTILNIDVLSFNRLTYHVFRELGINTGTLLDDSAKNLILRRIVASHGDEFSVISGDIRRMGFVDELKSMLTELDEYCVSDEELEKAAESVKAPALSAKLKDILLLKKYFREWIGNSSITSQGVMERLAAEAHSSEYLRGSTVVFDGFTGFTPVQLNFVRELLRISAEVYVVLTMDTPVKCSEKPDITDLFYITKNTYYTLKRIAAEIDVPVAGDIVLDEPYRFRGKDDLSYIEKSFLRYGCESFKGVGGNVFLHNMADAKIEVEYAAEMIKGLLMQGYRYREIAVVAPDEGYSPYVSDIFEARGIPVFTDEKTKGRDVPLAAFVKNYFGMIKSGFSVESVMSFLRTGILKVSREDQDCLENLLLLKGIDRRYKWEKPWQEEKEEALRVYIMGGAELLPEGRAAAAEYTRAMYAVIRYFEVDDNVRLRAEAFRRAADERRAKEYLGAYEALMKLFEKICDILGDESVDIEEYTDILFSGMDSLELGLIPTSADAVVYGDMTRSRVSGVRVLFLLGATSDKIPQVFNSGGILSQPERINLCAGGLSIAPPDRERSLTARLYLYMALTAASDAVYISYCRKNPDGSGAQKSYLIAGLEKKLGYLSDVSVSGLETENIYSGAQLEKAVCTHIGELNEDPGAEWDCRGQIGTVISAMSSDEALWDRFKDDLVRAQRRGEASLSRETADRLYEDGISGSISKLETYAACAYRFFLRYVLKLYPRKELSFKAVDFGNLMHEAMERLGRDISSGMVDINDLSGALDDDSLEGSYTEKLLADSFDKAAGAYEEKGFFEDSKNRFFLGMIRRTFTVAARNAVYQLKCGKFEIAAVESEFRSSFDDGAFKLFLSGKTDRIDTCLKDGRLYVRILDYKSNKKELSLADIYYGISLQLPVYLSEALKKYGDSAEPAGMFYYHMADPVINAESDMTDEEAGESVRKEMRLAGAYASDSEAASLMDTEETKCVMKTGSNAVSAEELSAILDYSEGKLVELAREAAGGRIEAAPYRKKDGTSACDYCDFARICGFSGDGGDAGYRDLAPMSKDKVLEFMGR